MGRVHLPDSDDVLASLGEGYAAQGKAEQAAESYRRAPELDPSNEHVQRELDRLGM